MGINFSSSLTNSMGISLGGLEIATDYLFANPDFYEPELTEVKSTIYKKDVKTQKHNIKPIRPKVTKERILNKFNILADNKITDLDEVIDIQCSTQTNTNIDITFDDTEVDNSLIEEDKSIIEANQIAQRLLNEVTENEIIDNESNDFEDDDDFEINEDDLGNEDDDFEINEDDLGNEDDDFEINEDDDFDDIDNTDDNFKIEKSNLDDNNEIENDTEEDDEFDIDEDDLGDEDDEFDIDEGDLGDDDLSDNDLGEDDLGDNNKTYVNSNNEQFTDDLFDIDEDDLGDIEETPSTNNDVSNNNKVSSSTNNDVSNNNKVSSSTNNITVNTNKASIDSTNEASNSDEIKRMQQKVADMERQIQKLKEKSTSETASNIKDSVIKNNKKDNLDDLIDINNKVHKQQDTAENIYDKYTVMSIDSLYKVVKQYMIELGVSKRPIDLTAVNQKFGELNIRKLIQKSYLIKVGKGVTIGR